MIARRHRRPIKPPKPAERRRQRRSSRGDADGLGCHAGKATMRAAAEKAGMSETLARYAKDYPAGPHDQPQSMCPAFGSLRVGLRMRRTATVLSGSACCVYGLDLHLAFLWRAAHRRLRAVQLRDARHRQAVRGHPRGRVQARRSRQIRRDRRHQSLRADRLGRAAATAAEGDRRRPHHRHRRAGLRRADPRGSQGRARRRDAATLRATRPSTAPCRRRAAPRAEMPTVTLLGEMFPADPVQIGGLVEAARPRRRPRRADARMARTLCRARLRRRRGDPSVLHRLACASSRRRVGRSSARRRSASRERRPGSTPSPRSATSRPTKLDAAKARLLPAIQGRARRRADPWPHHALRLRRFGIDRRRGCSSRAARTCAMSAPPARARRIPTTIAIGCEAHGVEVPYRASLEQDLAAMRRICARPRDRHDAGRAGGQDARDPGALFHQPDFGAAADGRRRRGIARARSSTPRSAAASRFAEMQDFFAGVGEGFAAGVWREAPKRAARVRVKQPQGRARVGEELGAC